MSAAKHTPGPWAPVSQAVGAGYASKRPWTVQRGTTGKCDLDAGRWHATNGRVHRYATEASAQKAADKLNLDENSRRERAAIAKATGSQS